MKSSDIEMKERKQLVGSTTTITTFRDAAIADISLQTGGRFNNAPVVTGSTPSQAWPRLPEGNPWAEDRSGVEPPLGYKINDLEVTGTPAEVQQSLAELANASPTPVSSPGAMDAAPALAEAPLSLVKLAPPPSPTHEGGGVPLRRLRKPT
jgi:hypothetical protein